VGANAVLDPSSTLIDTSSKSSADLTGDVYAKPEPAESIEHLAKTNGARHRFARLAQILRRRSASRERFS
jgi:hypothetical protein